jgi:putative tricarboxylic transport membrane protein
MKRAKNQKEWGKGVIEGVIAPETANNIECGTAMIPLLTFGIPGDVVTAVMLGAFIAQGLRPGPQLFAQQPTVMLSLFIAMYFATVAMYFIGHGCIMFFSRVLEIKRSILYSVVIILCIAGTFAVRNSFVDIISMVVLAALAYAARKFGFPVPPIALGFILGGMLEVQFRRSVIMGAGDITIFFGRPISAFFLGITLMAVIYFIWSQFQKKKNPEARPEVRP